MWKRVLSNTSRYKPHYRNFRNFSTERQIGKRFFCEKVGKTTKSSICSTIWNTKPCRIVVKVGAFHVGILLGAAIIAPEPFSIVKGMYRFISCFVVTSIIALDYKVSLHKKEGEEYNEILHKVHDRSAKKLLALFQYNKGIFIKFGQHLAALDYLLPDEYTSKMKVLQSSAPKLDFSKIENVFLEEYGKTAHEM